jgi:prepilin-type N-terminal cleavage/methylation domain-containing protein
MWAKQSKFGFTIIELLVVISVIGVLAAAVLVSYSNVQNRARQAAIQSELSSNSTKILLSATSSGRPPTTVEVLSTGDAKLSVSLNLYNIVTYCSSDTGFVLAAESKSGDKFYTMNNTKVVQDNAINTYSPCVSLGVQNTDATAASITYMGMATTSCATENNMCTFSGTATIAYGYGLWGKFTAIANMTSPVWCNNTIFGDPAVGAGKSCYIINN